MLMWTLAPSSSQSRSLSAKKISPVFLSRLRTWRLALPRPPLEVAYPNAELGGLLGVGVDLEAVELARADLREPANVVVRAVGDDLLLQIEQEVDGDVQEVA